MSDSVKPKGPQQCRASVSIVRPRYQADQGQETLVGTIVHDVTQRTANLEGLARRENLGRGLITTDMRNLETGLFFKVHPEVGYRQPLGHPDELQEKGADTWRLGDADPPDWHSSVHLVWKLLITGILYATSRRSSRRWLT